ncbi:hypothetical protein QR680_002589 [Steinernema hermaphroditum]|uniref:Uncharacterized protein n=1 Tax=Steinernema hermaphroditum TaxID=289476 RepID=A0AA39H395_9BILA|nr:hypothetical protein QR680_002589 [Steinernema hermaphroditum]
MNVLAAPGSNNSLEMQFQTMTRPKLKEYSIIALQSRAGCYCTDQGRSRNQDQETLFQYVHSLWNADGPSTTQFFKKVGKLRLELLASWYTIENTCTDISLWPHEYKEHAGQHNINQYIRKGLEAYYSARKQLSITIPETQSRKTPQKMRDRLKTKFGVDVAIVCGLSDVRKVSMR